MALIGSILSHAQVSPEKLMGTMERPKWVKTGQALRKAVHKDSLDTEPKYLLALYFLNQNNPSYHIDSADFYSRKAFERYVKLSLRDRDRLRRIPLDSAHLMALKERIDSSAFERAKSTHTEDGYQKFIRQFPDSKQKSAASELRDEIAFTEALKKNTWMSFQVFFNKYPASHRSREAHDRYEKLLYEDKTGDRRLDSYVKFYHQYPTSPFRKLVEKNIFELSTASGMPGDFENYVRQYPGSRWASMARNILFSLSEETDGLFPDTWLTDSLRHVRKLNESYWVPVYKAGKYGFINSSGEEVMPLQLDGVDESYRCGRVEDRLLLTSEGLMTRNGKVLFKGSIKDAEYIGAGYVEVTADSGHYLLHESGFRVGDPGLQASSLVANRYLALKKGGKWALSTLTGRILLPFTFDDINAIDSIIVLARNGRKILSTPFRISKTAEGAKLNEEFVFDDVRRWAPGEYWVRNGILEGVVDAQLKFIIPLDRQVLRKTAFGFVRGKDKVFVKGIPSLESQPFASVTEQGSWVRLKKEKGKTILYDRTSGSSVEGDSAWFQGPVAFLGKGDSTSVYLPSGLRLAFHSAEHFHLMEFADDTWIVLPEKKSKAVYDANAGHKLFSMDFDQLEPVREDLFLITRGTKKGLIGLDGKFQVPVEYDAIVQAGPTSFSLLKEKKFGWYELTGKTLTKPMYDRNIKAYNREFRVGYKNSGYGFITPDGKPVGAFEWEEVQYWNDSVAWVKKNVQWLLVDIRKRQVRLDKIRSFNPVREDEKERVYIVRQDNAFGVISNRKGTVVPIQYSDIVNLGSPEAPLYFTERHIEEAAISVVIYYDQAGQIIRKQAIEASEFDKVYCDN